jgi:hypothetical protein
MKMVELFDRYRELQKSQLFTSIRYIRSVDDKKRKPIKSHFWCGSNLAASQIWLIVTENLCFDRFYFFKKKPNHGLGGSLNIYENTCVRVIL